MVGNLSLLDIIHLSGKFYISLTSCMEHILIDIDQYLRQSWATNIVWLLVLVVCHDHSDQITHVVFIRIVPYLLVTGL